MRRTNKRRIVIVLATSAVVLGAGVAAWAQQLEVKKDAWLATTGGNVGIGTTTPAQKLEIYEGKLQITRAAGWGPQIYLNATGSGGTEWQITSTNDAGPGGGGNLALSANGTTQFVMTSWGDVGIGTNYPAGKLDVAGLMRTIGTSTGTWSAGELDFDDTATGALWQIQQRGSNDTSAPLDNLDFFSYNGTNYQLAVALTLAGQVGIGTTTPQNALDVKGSWCNPTCGQLQIESTNGAAGLHLANSTGSAWEMLAPATSNSLAFFDRNANQYRMLIDSAGNVGIGTTTPDALLTVNGNADAVAWNQLSSRSYKEQIRRVSKAEQRRMLDTLMRMKPSRYKYKPRFSDGGRERLGFIAEEMPKEVLAKNGKAVDLYELQTLTIAALKEQEREIRSLRHQLKALRASRHN